jgi:hypothetical protein
MPPNYKRWVEDFQKAFREQWDRKYEPKPEKPNEAFRQTSTVKPWLSMLGGTAVETPEPERKR